MAKVISVANMKGGVGKTTLVVMLAEAFAAHDPAASILVIDADPQASASVSLMGDEHLRDTIQDGDTLDAFIGDNLTFPARKITRHLGDYVKRQVSTTTHDNRVLQIDVLPCGFHMRLVERVTIREFHQQNLGPDAYESRLYALLAKELTLLRQAYDYIVIDCAPSLSVVNEIMVRSADLVLLPTIPDFISAFGLSAFLNSVWDFPIAKLPKPSRAPYVVISRLEKGLRQHKESAADLIGGAAEPQAKYRILKTAIEKSVRFSEALAKGDEVPTFTNKWSPGLLHSVVWPLHDEIKEVLDAL